MARDVRLHLVPIPRVVADLLAARADRQHAAQHLDLPDRLVDLAGELGGAPLVLSYPRLVRAQQPEAQEDGGGGPVRAPLVPVRPQDEPQGVAVLVPDAIAVAGE